MTLLLPDLGKPREVPGLDAAVVQPAEDPLVVRSDAQHEAVAEQPLGLQHTWRISHVSTTVKTKNLRVFLFPSCSII